MRYRSVRRGAEVWTRTGIARRAVPLMMVLVALAACGTHTVPVAVTNPSVRVGPLLVSDVHVVRPTSGSYSRGDAASVDFLVQNNGADRDALVAATVPQAGKVELVVDGRTVQRVLLPADRTVTRGTELRVVRLQQDVRAGDSLTVTFRFERAGEVTVQAPLH